MARQGADGFTMHRIRPGFGVGCVKIRSRSGPAAAHGTMKAWDAIPGGAAAAADKGYRALVVDDEAALADVVASYLIHENLR